MNLCVHGLMHGYYMDGVDSHDISDYYYTIKKQRYMVSENEIRRRLEAFFDLLRCNGIDKKIDTMIPPSFVYNWNELSYILRDYGIRYVGTIYRHMRCGDEAAPATIGIEKSGMITYDRHNNPIPWDAYGGPYEDLPLFSGVVGIHWPNLLHRDPLCNMETVDRAEAYFRRCGNEWGTILSHDVTFYVTQALYKLYAKAEERDGVLTVDLSDMPSVDGINDCFYVSSVKPITSGLGCTFSLYEKQTTHFTYKITPHPARLELRV